MFERPIKVSVNEYVNNPLYCVSLLDFTRQCGLKYTGVNLQTLQDKDMILLSENNIRGGICSVMGERLSDENKKNINVQMQIISTATQCHNRYLIMKLNLRKLLN